MNDSHYNKNLKEFTRENRNDSTFGEILLWKKLLSKKKTGHQFNRQFPIDDFIVDFISRKLKLVIEVDGSYHENVYEKDVDRDKQLNQLGYTVLRFSEKDVRFNFNNVSRAILIWIHEWEEKVGSNANPQAPFAKGERKRANENNFSKGNLFS